MATYTTLFSATLAELEERFPVVADPRLKSLPHIGTKNVSVSEAHHLLDLGKFQPEKFVLCLPDEGVVEVASTQLVELIQTHEADELQQRFPEASEEVPFEWFRTLLLAPASSRRFLCAWLQV